MKRNTKQVKIRNKLAARRKRCEDTIDEEEQEQTNVKKTEKGKSAETPKTAAKKKEETTQVAQAKKSKEKERTSKEVGKKRMSAEITEREKEPKEKENVVSPAKIIAAARHFCKYLLDMKESSLSTYFDEHLAKYAPPNETTVEWEKNLSKNRSKEHKAYDSSRVRIDGPNGDEYINASLLKFDQLETEYIITQYPLKDTVRDFWRMVSQRTIERVVTIFEPYVDEAIEEFNKVPSIMASPGTPVSVHKQVSAENATVQTKEEIVNNSVRCESTLLKSFYPLFADHYMQLEGWLINTRKVECDERNKTWLDTYTIEIVGEGCSEASFVRVFNCTTWPWKQVPNEERKLLALARAPKMDLIQKPTDPIVVMCDLGLDRSATIVLTSVLIEMILSGKLPDCDAIFRKMRDQRAGCFTMSMFYTYAIRTVLFYLRIKFRKMQDVGEETKQMVVDALQKVPFVPNAKKI